MPDFIPMPRYPDDLLPVSYTHLDVYKRQPIPIIGTVRAGFGAFAFEEDYGEEYALSLIHI